MGLSLPEKPLHLEDLLLVINGIIHSKVRSGQVEVVVGSLLGQVEVWSGSGQVRLGRSRAVVGSDQVEVRASSSQIEVRLGQTPSTD